MKKYRAAFLAGIALLYAIAAVIFPDTLLPDAEIFADIFDAISGTVEPAPTGEVK